VSVILFSGVTAGPAPHSTAITSVALVFSTSRREGFDRSVYFANRITLLTFRCLWLGLKDGLDRAALVRRTVAFRYLIQRKGKIEDLAGWIFPVQTRSISFGRKRRTGAGPP